MWSWARPDRLSPTRQSRRLLALFGLTVLVPGGLLAVIGARAILSGHEAAEQDVQRRLGRAADAIGREIQRELTDWQTATARIAWNSPLDVALLPETLRAALDEPGALAVVAINADGLTAWPPSQLSYELDASLPATVATPLPESFSGAEIAELRARDYATATRLYEALLATASTETRPLLLHRLARTARNAGRIGNALRRYEELQAIRTPIGGLPADLLARHEICDITSTPPVSERFATCAASLYRDLIEGRWRLDEARYRYYAASARDWATRAAGADGTVQDLVTREARKMALTEAVAGLRTSASASSAGPIAIATSGDYLVVGWAATSGVETAGRRAIVLASDWATTNVWPRLASTAADDDLEAEITDLDAGVLFRPDDAVRPDTAAGVPVATRSLADARLPLRVHVWPRDPAAFAAPYTRDRTFYAIALVLAVVVMGLGAFFTLRVVRQELAVAALKSDFVSAVSHEFRSPLTGIRQLGEMLMRGRVTSDDRRQEYYERITYESDRLSRLVENLLDFSRIEAGRREYRMERLDPAAWLAGIARDFSAQLSTSGRDVRTSIPADLLPIEADREALATVVYNLLDNAVKYSPDQPAVWLDVAADARGLVIRVRDEGPGISADDQRRMFDAFHRGTGDATSRVKGAGIGLSLVRRIVAAHRGRIECESQLGHGTTFTIVLPVSAASDAARAALPLGAPRRGPDPTRSHS